MPAKLTEFTLGAGDANYPVAPQVNLSALFVPDRHFIVDEHATAVVRYSFDGVTDEGKLDPTIVPLKFKVEIGKRQKIWFRNPAAGAGVNIVVESRTDV